MSKFAIAIFADASNSSDESLGRVLNALVMANDLKEKNIEFLMFFQGAGTRSISVLEDTAHPGHGLYSNIKNQIAGVSKACSVVFGADTKSVKLLEEFTIPGIGGATSLATYLLNGYTLVSF